MSDTGLDHAISLAGAMVGGGLLMGGGAVGAAILRHALEHDWVEHIRDSRALLVTPVGVRELATTFGIEGAPCKSSDAQGAQTS